MSALAKQYGVTAGEARKMVEKGKVDFNTFRAVMEDMLAGSALKSGETTRGAFANVGAALARFGAALLSGVFPHLKTVFGAMITLIDSATEKVGPLVDAVGKGIGDAFQKAVPYVQAFIRGFQGFTASGGGPFVAIVNAGNSLRKVLDKVLPAMKSLGTTATSTILPGILKLGQALLPLGSAVMDSLGRLAPVVAKVGQALGKLIVALLPTVQKFATQVAAVLGPGLRSLAGIIATQVAPALLQFISAITPVAKFVIGLIADSLIGALKGAIQFLQGALNIISGVLKVFTGIFTGDWSKVWEGVKQIAEGIWNGIVGAFKVFINIGVGKAFKLGAKALMATGRGLWNGLKALFTAGPNLIMKMIRSLWSTVSGLFSKGANAIGQSAKKGVTAVLNWFKKLPTQIWNAIKNIPTRVAQAFSNAARGATNAIKQLPKMVTGAVRTAGSWLVNSGKEIIRGLIRGITSMAGNVKKAVKDVLQRARNLLPFSPAKEGPFSGKGWTLYSGRSIVEGLMQGIEQKESALRQTLEKTLTAPQLALSSGNLSVVGGDTHVTVILDGEPIRATVRSEIRRNNRDIYRAYSSGIGGAR